MMSVITQWTRSLFLLTALSLGVPQLVDARPKGWASSYRNSTQLSSLSRKKLIRNITSCVIALGGLMSAIFLYNVFAPHIPPPVPSEQGRCPVCLEDSEKFHPIQRKIFRCSHWTCTECFKGLMKTQIQQEEYDGIIDGEMVHTRDVPIKYRLADRGCPLCRQPIL